MDIRERPVYVRVAIFFIGMSIWFLIAAGIELLLRRYLGIYPLGAVPKTVLYILPVNLIGYRLGFFGKKKLDRLQEPPSDDKWTN